METIDQLIDTEENGTLNAFATPVEFICGGAGSGKTFTIRERQKADPDYGILTGSTGISAINMDAITINSLIGFFDADSLRDAYMSGAVNRKLLALAKGGIRNVVIDEVSMLSAEVLDVLMRAFDEVNGDLPKEVKFPLGLILVGDYLQLAPVKAEYAFKSQFWPRFAENTTRLVKNWRQGDERFLDALNFARAGKGKDCAGALADLGVEFHENLDSEFDGTTVIAKNDKVDRFNSIRLDLVKGDKFAVMSRRWCEDRIPGEWKNIPDVLQLKVGAYVMLLTNSYDEYGSLVYANGDCGHVLAFDKTSGEVKVKLVRNGREVAVKSIIRGVEHKHKPSGWGDVKDSSGGWLPEKHRNTEKKRYVSGQVQYFPIRLAWASTVHKSQGLTLDRVQIDVRDGFFGFPGMSYTALSRARTAEGLRIVGDRATFEKRVKMDLSVKGWV